MPEKIGRFPVSHIERFSKRHKDVARNGTTKSHCQVHASAHLCSALRFALVVRLAARSMARGSSTGPTRITEQTPLQDHCHFHDRWRTCDIRTRTPHTHTRTLQQATEGSSTRFVQARTLNGAQQKRQVGVPCVCSSPFVSHACTCATRITQPTYGRLMSLKKKLTGTDDIGSAPNTTSTCSERKRRM